MYVTAKFRQQHIELYSLIAKVTVLLDKRDFREHEFEAWSKTRELVSKLTIHLLMEDEIVYSHFLTCPEENLRDLAGTLQSEVGGLIKSAKVYKAAWPTHNKVQSCPEEFIEESRKFLEAIQKRISLENEVLFKEIESRSDN